MLVPNHAAVRQSRPYIRVAEVHDLRVYYPFLEFCDESTYMGRHKSDAALCRWISRLPEKTFKEALKRYGVGFLFASFSELCGRS